MSWRTGCAILVFGLELHSALGIVVTLEEGAFWVFAHLPTPTPNFFT